MPPGSLAGLGPKRTIEAAGQIVIPGGIDPHVHCRWPMPTPGQTQHNLTDGPDRVSQAALFGGTTTMLDFALVDGDNTVQQAIERRQKEWAGDCHCDYGFHVMVQGKLDWSVPDQIVEAVQAGHATVKMFTTDITPSRKGRMVPFGSVMEVLTALAKAGGVAAIHAEDNDLVMHMYEKLMREGRRSFHNIGRGIHTTLSEDLAFNRVIRLAANIPGAALYMLHTSAADRRTGDRPHGPRAGHADLRRDAAPVHPDVFRRGLQAAERADLPHLPVAQIRRGSRRAVGRHQPWRDPDRRHRRNLLPAQVQAAGRPKSTTPPAAMPGSSRACR